MKDDEVKMKMIQKQNNNLVRSEKESLDSVSDGQIETPQNENESVGEIDGTNLIAWIEKRPGSAISVKKDLKELSDKIGFMITGYEVEKAPFNGGSNEVVKAYTDTYDKIPEDVSKTVKKWLMKVAYWTEEVKDADVRVEGSSDKSKTEFLLNADSFDQDQKEIDRQGGD